MKTERLKRLINKLTEISADALLVTNPTNVTYISGFKGDSSHLIVTPNGSVLLTDGRYLEQAKIECIKEIEIFNWINNERYGIKSYQYWLDNLNADNFAFESSVLSYNDYHRLATNLKVRKFIPVLDIIEQMRKTKDKFEIEILTQACKVSDDALQATLPIIKPGVSEIEICAELEYNLKTMGANDLSFDTIVLSGARTSLLHGKPGNKKLESGDFLLFDFGACIDGYHADISRTFIIGKADKKQLELYSIIRQAQQSAVEALKDGITGNLPDTIVRSIIPDKYKSYYYPGMGHGVGLDIHEFPFIKQEASFTMMENMVITIEPGIYIPTWGGLRIEDTVLVTKDRYVLLSNFPRELMLL